MPRPRRILLNTLTTLSLLLCLAILALWFRSTKTADTLTFITNAGHGHTLSTVPHGIAITWTEALQELTADYDPLPPGWSIAHHKWESSETIHLPDPEISGNRSVHSSYITFTYTRPPFSHRSLGFALRRDTIPRISHARRIAGYLNYNTFNSPPVSRMWTLTLPSWFLLTAFAALPAFRIFHALRQRRRRAKSLCPKCGYDLRATPNRCPECGTRQQAELRTTTLPSTS